MYCHCQHIVINSDQSNRSNVIFDHVCTVGPCLQSCLPVRCCHNHLLLWGDGRRSGVWAPGRQVRAQANHAHVPVHANSGGLGHVVCHLLHHVCGAEVHPGNIYTGTVTQPY